MPQPTPGSSVGSSHLPPHVFTGSSGEYLLQQLRQSSFQDMDAWADTNWPQPPAGELRMIQLVPDTRPKSIEHYLGKPRPSSPSQLSTSLTRCVATAKTVCLSFVVLAVVALCVLIFSIVGEPPAVTVRSTDDGSEVLRLPTVVSNNELDFSVTPDLPPSDETDASTSEETQTYAFELPAKAYNSTGDGRPRSLGGCASCRPPTRRAVPTVHLGGRAPRR